MEGMYGGISFSWSQIDIRQKSKKGNKEVREDDDNGLQDKTVDVLQAWIWHHDQSLACYFIFLNPMFVIAANFCGLEIFALDLLILMVLSQLLEKITHDDSAMEGEALLVQILKCEQKFANETYRESKLKVGHLLLSYIRFITNLNQQCRKLIRDK